LVLIAAATLTTLLRALRIPLLLVALIAAALLTALSILVLVVVPILLIRHRLSPVLE
jgi:hypothetical protein